MQPFSPSSSSQTRCSYFCLSFIPTLWNPNRSSTNRFSSFWNNPPAPKSPVFTISIIESASGSLSSVPPSYLLQLPTPGSHEHHCMFSVGVGGHGAHALSPVLVQRVSLDHPQASERLVQHQAAEIISDLLRLWVREEGEIGLAVISAVC